MPASADARGDQARAAIGHADDAIGSPVSRSGSATMRSG
jgi:hypothetical protein